ncbi:MAG: hypothetical protein Q9191_003720 [Dirinaria sp. TL-2023a]
MSEADTIDPVKDPKPIQPGVTPLLAQSAQGATYLVLLRIGSRATTFLLNQILLRYLSPETLGIATQLDLFASSTLYFACESIRVALQRQRREEGREYPGKWNEARVNEDTTGDGQPDEHVPSQRAQETINLAYIAVAIGVPLSYILSNVYLKSAGSAVHQTPYIYEALHGYIVATILELLNEPSFAIAQQQMLYSTRATAETFATSTKCVSTCAIVIWAARTGTELGALPFAIGQISYALVLNAVYLSRVYTLAFENQFSILPQIILPASPESYYFQRFSRPLVNLASNLYGQSVFKQLLTNGDSYLITSFSQLAAQGAYALAANYGGLLARILLQPIEESSRSFFARLLTNSPSPTSAPQKPTKHPEPTPHDCQPPNPYAHAAHFLTTILQLYLLFSTSLLALGPTIAPLLLRTIAGPTWAHTEAPAVLAVYSYYIPLLAINGLLEAFVSAVANPAELRRQSAWWIAFSAGFVACGYLVLRVCELEARGLVLANCASMGMRIVWSWGFVSGWLRDRGQVLSLKALFPGSATMGSALVSAVVLKKMEAGFDGSWMDVGKWVAVAACFGSVVIFDERKFVMQCYEKLKSRSRPSSVEARTKKEK